MSLVREHMTSPAVTVRADAPIAEVALLCVDLVGVLTRQPEL